MKRLIFVLTAMCFLILARICPAAAQDLPNFLKDARAGEWVAYDIPGDLVQTTTVTRVEDGRAFLYSETMRGDLMLHKEEDSIPLSHSMPLKGGTEADKTRLFPGQVEINGRIFSCTVMETTQESGVIRLFMSEEVPVMGLVKIEQEKNDQVVPVITLRDFGFEKKKSPGGM